MKKYQNLKKKKGISYKNKWKHIETNEFKGTKEFYKSKGIRIKGKLKQIFWM